MNANTNHLTKHASVRMQHRAIPPVVVDWLELFGVVEYQEDAEMVYFDRRSLRRLARYTGGLSDQFDKINESYLVRASNGQIITVGYRSRRISRK